MKFTSIMDIIGTSVIAIIVGGFLLLVVLLFFKIFGKIKLNIGDSKLVASKDNNDPYFCFSLPDFWKALDLNNCIKKMKYSGYIMARQMRIVVSKGAAIEDLLVNNLRETLMKINENDMYFELDKNETYKLYQIIVSNTRYATTKKFEEYLSDPLFNQMDEAEFVKFKQEKIKTMVQYAVVFLDNNFHSNEITRQELGDQYQRKYGEVVELYNQIFDECRIISLDMQKKLSDNEKEFDDLLRRYSIPKENS